VRGEQRHPADLSQVDPDQVAGCCPAGLRLDLPRCEVLAFLLRLDYVHALIGEQLQHAVDGICRQVTAFESGG
jgi:hypothetical protein